MLGGRFRHAAVLLGDGRVLVAGGKRSADAGPPGPFAEVYDPATDTWASTGALPVGDNSHRDVFASGVLGDGRVMLAGGVNDLGQWIADVHLFDPTTSTWIAAAPLPAPRVAADLVLLNDGRMALIRGGSTSTLVYDPTTDAWSDGPILDRPAVYASSPVRLADGSIVIAGGLDTSGNPTTDVHVADAAFTTWTTQTPLATARQAHRSTRLGDGRVLLTGGQTDLGQHLAGSELVDGPGAWRLGPTMSEGRFEHTATVLADGTVFVAGGGNLHEPLSSWQRLDPATETWAQSGDLVIPRRNHNATLLSTGEVLITGGMSVAPYNSDYNGLDEVDVFDPATGTVTSGVPLSSSRWIHTATPLDNGSVLLVGGAQSYGQPEAERYVLETGTVPSAQPTAKRLLHTANRLPHGRVLVAGGSDNSGGAVSSAEIYDAVADSWSPAPSLPGPRTAHDSVVLADGRIALIGGNDGVNFLASVDLFDPATETWVRQGLSAVVRSAEPLVLADGRLLLVGGNVRGTQSASTDLASSDLRYLESGGNLVVARQQAVVTQLLDGRVLVTGGHNQPGMTALALTEIQGAPTSDATYAVVYAGQPATASTGTTADGDDPVAASVSVPAGTNGGSIVIQEGPAQVDSTSQYNVLGTQVSISAPDASVDAPLVLTFVLDGSVVPEGQDPTEFLATVNVLRDGVAAGECAGSSIADPDPCVSERSLSGDDLVIKINSSHASDWVPVSVTPSEPDEVPPTLTVPGPITAVATSASGASVPFTGLSAADDVDPSPAISCEDETAVPVASGEVFLGAHTVTCIATDASGNASTPASFTVDVRYDFQGFRAPIDAGILNAMKSGATAPVKFRIGDGAGGVLSSLATVARVQIATFTCEQGAPADPVEEVGSGSTGLTFDGGQYVYSWKSPRNKANTCQRLWLSLADGQHYAADFVLK